MPKLSLRVFGLIAVLWFTCVVVPVPATAPGQPSTPVAVRAQPQDQTASSLEGIDEFIAAQMAQWKVPGLAIAVVQDGNVILSKGYGYRDREKQLPVTPQTLFAIGSITKSFTVTVLGMLADEGKLDWDQPVREYLPNFELKDSFATQRMTPRDLVTHRSGLPRHDLLWYGSSLTRQEMFERLRYLEPNKDFRTAYQYQNLMFMTAGYLAGRINGSQWEDLVREKIFVPLGMTSSNFSVEESQRRRDFALPYSKVEEEVKQIPFRNIDEIGPAGSINSNVEEMIRYVQFHLNQGKHGEQQLLSENMAGQMQTPQMVMPGTIRYDELGHNSYGMGLLINYYRGQKVVSHGGGIDGFISLLTFMPRKKIGMMLLTNLSGNNPLNTIVSRNVYDRLLGLEPIDWAARIQEEQEKQEKAEEEDEKKKEEGQRVTGTSPSHPLGDYAGTYQHPGYGTIRIETASDALRLSFNSFTIPLAHYHYDVFETPKEPQNPLQEEKVSFALNVRGEIESLAIQLESNVDPIVFTRQPEKRLTERSYLETFVGTYQLATTPLTVSLRGDTLTLSAPGQPARELVPTKELFFELKGAPGVTLEFRRDASGRVTELVSHQPNGTFVAKRKP